MISKETAAPPSSATPSKGTKLSKEAAALRLRTLKQQAMITSILVFGVFSWLALPHGTGQASGTPTQVATSSQQAQSDQSQSGFFDQGGGGYGFSNSQNAPVAGSGAS